MVIRCLEWIGGIFGAFVFLLCSWCLYAWAYMPDIDDQLCEADDAPWLPVQSSPAAPSGNSHQRRIARRKLERADKLRNA